VIAGRGGGVVGSVELLLKFHEPFGTTFAPRSSCRDLQARVDHAT